MCPKNVWSPVFHYYRTVTPSEHMSNLCLVVADKLVFWELRMRNVRVNSKPFNGHCNLKHVLEEGHQLNVKQSALSYITVALVP